VSPAVQLKTSICPLFSESPWLGISATQWIRQCSHTAIHHLRALCQLIWRSSVHTVALLPLWQGDHELLHGCRTLHCCQWIRSDLQVKHAILFYGQWVIFFVQGYLSVPLSLGALLSQCILYVYWLTFIPALAYSDNRIQFNSMQCKLQATLGVRPVQMLTLNGWMDSMHRTEVIESCLRCKVACSDENSSVRKVKEGNIEWNWIRLYNLPLLDAMMLLSTLGQFCHVNPRRERSIDLLRLHLLHIPHGLVDRTSPAGHSGTKPEHNCCGKSRD